MEQATHSTGQGSIISLSIRDRAALQATYMPFLRNGGLFMPTSRECPVGHPLFLLLTLPDAGERLGINGRVAWITPLHAQGNRTAGIGIQFQDDGIARQRIEQFLDEHLNSDALTHTM